MAQRQATAPSSVEALTQPEVPDGYASVVAPEPRDLPAILAEHDVQRSFVDRMEPTDLNREDVDTAGLVMRIQAGDTRLFDRLYVRYFDRVYGYLRVTLKDAHEAEDVCQEVFARVFGALPSYERRAVPFRAWLFRIARNAAINRANQRRRLSVETPEELDGRRELADVSESDSAGWLDGRLLALVEQLSLPQRQVISLRYMMGLSTAEIATVLHRSPDGVRQLHHRAMGFLRQRAAALDERPRPSPATGVRRHAMRRARRHAPVLHARRQALATGRERAPR